MEIDMLDNKWNIFACTLEEILVNRGHRFSDLYRKELAFHPQSVRRLQLSLTQPRKCPVLNPDDLEEVIRIFYLDEQEKKHLHAAVIAAVAQEELAKRMDKEDDVFLATEQIFSIVLQALWKRKNEEKGLGAFRGED
jgi:hypothetical protein